jgi:two-component system chemotaxis sensor kinase CheA
MAEELDELLLIFQTETLDNLAAMEQALLRLEVAPDDDEALQVIFRVVHTLKGDTSILGLAVLAAFAHELENVLDRLREGALSGSPALTTCLLRASDLLRRAIAELGTGRRQDSFVVELVPLLVQLGKVTGQPTAFQDDGSSSLPLMEVNFEPPAPLHSHRTVRIEVEKLDRLLNLTAELAIARGKVTSRLQDVSSPRALLLEAHAESDRPIAELQEVVTRARLLPLGPIFRQFHRTVRDLALTTGKQVELRLEGEDVEVDISIAERLREPLTHMIRNAVDHGIEAPEIRAARHKHPSGTITLRARREAGTIEIAVSDDGAGLARDRIFARAAVLGLCSETDELTDDEVFRFILEPGFTTATEVTPLSGRGVGMDVVRRHVEAIRGTLDISAQPELGTTFILRAPLLLAMIDGFCVGVGQETFVLPLDAVIECTQLPDAEHSQPAASGIVNLRGEALPYLRLGEALRLHRSALQRQSVVVVKSGELRAGIAVDSLLGQRQVLVKPLGAPFQPVAGVSGASIQSDGRVALILDLSHLLKQAQLSSCSASRAEKSPASLE